MADRAYFLCLPNDHTHNAIMSLCLQFGCLPTYNTGRCQDLEFCNGHPAVVARMVDDILRDLLNQEFGLLQENTTASVPSHCLIRVFELLLG